MGLHAGDVVAEVVQPGATGTPPLLTLAGCLGEFLEPLGDLGVGRVPAALDVAHPAVELLHRLEELGDLDVTVLGQHLVDDAVDAVECAGAVGQDERSVGCMITRAHHLRVELVGDLVRLLRMA